MDEEQTLYPIVKDLNRLAEDLEEESQEPRDFKNLIVLNDNLEKKDWAPKLEDHKLNNVQLEVFASRLIEHRKKIRERAKNFEEMHQAEPPGEKEDGPQKEVKLYRSFEAKKGR